MADRSSTGKWAAQHSLKLDWIDRHLFLGWLRQARPDVYRAAMLCLSPDEALDGGHGGQPPPAVIVLQDKPSRTRRARPAGIEAPDAPASKRRR